MKKIIDMNKKKFVKITTDILMTICLICLMLYQFTGQLFHEYAGAGMFLLFIFHHILNYKWLKNISKGKYSPLRIAMTSVNLLLLLDMIGLMVSGIMMSRYVFSFLNIRIGISFARTLHMLCSYWGFALMSVHIELHWSMIIRSLRCMPKNVIYIMRAISVIVSALGIYLFIKNKLWAYMLGIEQFVFADYEKSVLLSALEYMAIMVMFICITHYTAISIKGNHYDKK